MAQQVSGMAAWMSNIRTSMAKDPCRQLFEDQVQTHGFIFLEDYLENILDGPRQDPIIELVKTPARKKSAPKRTRAATSAAAKAKNATLFNIDESEPQEDTLHVADEPGDDPQSSSVPLNDVPPRTPPHKTSALHFPTLPAPSPLRKSVRVAREPSTDADLASAVVAPAQPPVLGKRTSWLTKAREVKAMEGVIPSRTSALGSGPGSIATSSHTVIPSNGVKRKSGDMLAVAPLTSEKSDEGRRAKVAKSSESDSAPEILTQAPPFVLGLTKVTEEHLEPLNDNEDEASFMGMFKRTVEGLGARAGKSMGKSLGGGAATAALAEARAAAEARVAERNKIPGEEVTESEERFTPRVEEPQLTAEPVRQPRESERRLSLSDIAPNHISVVHQLSPTAPRFAANESISTTPPNSPPPTCISGSSLVSPPLFNRQPPVFVPPIDHESVIPTSDLGDIIKDSQSAVNLFKSDDISRSRGQLPIDSTSSSSLSQTGAQLTAEHVRHSRESERRLSLSDIIPTNNRVIQSSSSATQSAADDSISTTPPNSPPPRHTSVCSLIPPLGPVFTFTRQPPVFVPPTSKQPALLVKTKTVQNDEGFATPGVFAMDIDGEVDQVPDDVTSVLEEEAGNESVMYTSDLGDIIKAGQSALEPGGIPRSHSQLSIASTSSSSQQSQAGFLVQATKLVNSMLGTGKKVKPEVKSLQLAAAAAKKQEEEANKKATRLKEMEARRQAALARKAEEDKTRAIEEEKKIKEESEKRKRERDETTEKRPLKTTTAPKKAEEDVMKKRKITVDEKKIEIKKPLSKDKDALPPSRLAKASLATPAAKVAVTSKTVKISASSALISSATYNASQNTTGSSTVKSATTETKPSKIGPPKGKAKAAVPQENEDKLPSAVVQNQMAARAMAQIRAAKQQSPEVPSESIELPDINSEYSDSEDEDRVRTFDPPNWAQSPELRQALQMQSTVDPDDIFGAIRPLRMEEVFRTRQSRFRARTSSANWSGTDRLTIEEEREYARRMGFTKHVS